MQDLVMVQATIAARASSHMRKITHGGRNVRVLLSTSLSPGDTTPSGSGVKWLGRPAEVKWEGVDTGMAQVYHISARTCFSVVKRLSLASPYLNAFKGSWAILPARYGLRVESPVLYNV
jgi:hypothetical protein